MTRYPWQRPPTAAASTGNNLHANAPSMAVAHSPDTLDANQARLAILERDEPKRRLIRDASALRKQRGITQAQMAEELGVPCRTLQEWLQGRRYPKRPGLTLLKRWLSEKSR
ncbi:helix-turn-helix domain-containing protein [Halomonas sp. 7T]|uniref:helix-turn-helix domain-containing protein n=1 Tax=Halomonas sp. 7T TaxID=2893469 RepID=UPI0021DB249A|nr:helix-turn-helix domain-containing protein [Halomonas sp. 7T]UXZ55640.1 helix-turn-helix domain-containing protein [Halomonas sp. 7T]